jgi:predicted nucleotidyltransferase
MHINNVFEHIFAKKTGVKLLRQLVLDGTERSGRELAKFAGISAMQAHINLQELRDEGLVTVRSIGNALVYKIKEDNFLVIRVLKGLFAAEKDLFEELEKEYIDRAVKRAICVILFGSVFEKKEKGNSDIDLFVLCRNESDKSFTEERFSDVGVNFLTATGNMLSPLIMSEKEYKTATKENKVIIQNIKGGKVLKGKLPY